MLNISNAFQESFLEEIFTTLEKALTVQVNGITATKIISRPHLSQVFGEDERILKFVECGLESLIEQGKMDKRTGKGKSSGYVLGNLPVFTDLKQISLPNSLTRQENEIISSALLDCFSEQSKVAEKDRKIELGFVVAKLSNLLNRSDFSDFSQEAFENVKNKLLTFVKHNPAYVIKGRHVKLSETLEVKQETRTEDPEISVDLS